MKAGRMNIHTEDQTAEIEYELNIIQLNKEHLFKQVKKDIIFKSPVLPPAGQSVATEDSFRVWRGRPLGEKVSQSEARAHSKCVFCADFGREMEHSSICICAGWGRSNNDLSPPRQANRGIETVPGLMLTSMSNDKRMNLLKR